MFCYQTWCQFLLFVCLFQLDSSVVVSKFSDLPLSQRTLQGIVLNTYACTCNPRLSVLEIMIRGAGLVQWKEHWPLVVVQCRQSSNSRIIHHHICVIRQELTKIGPLSIPGKCFHFCFCLVQVDVYSTLSSILTDHCIKPCSQYLFHRYLQCIIIMSLLYIYCTNNIFAS